MGRFIKEFALPKLKLRVESAIRGYLTNELTDEEFKGSVQSILNEFEGKSLLHQNIGQLTGRMEKENPGRKKKFEKIWILLDQVNAKIRKGFRERMLRGKGTRARS